MKKILILAVMVAAGYFAYQYFSGGNLSMEQKQVQALSDEFATARQLFTQAERSAAIGGVDTTSTADDVMARVGKLKEKLQGVLVELQDEKAIEMAKKLGAELQLFLDRQNR